MLIRSALNFFSIIGFLGLCLPSLAQDPKLDKPAPILAKDVKIYPWTANRRELKIDPKTKGIFDEHKVTVTSGKEQTRIRIKGEMKSGGGNLNGAPVLHLGKIALVPISERAGSIKVGVSAASDSTKYLIVLEVANEKLKTELTDFEEKKDYTWSVVKKDGTVTYSVFEAGEKKWSLVASENDVKAFGIGAFTRFDKQKTEIDFSIDN